MAPIALRLERERIFLIVISGGGGSGDSDVIHVRLYN